MGTIVLAGGAEFGGDMALLDRGSIEAAGGRDAIVSIIPAAAAPDKNHLCAGANGVKWFKKLGVGDAVALPLIDKLSANNVEVISALARSHLIYLLGGFPGHLAETLAGSRAWDTILSALDSGAVISGSSAGAMVLCEHFYDPHAERVLPGLNLISGACILPHHNTFGSDWVYRLKQLLPDAILIGIDERTGLIGGQASGRWRVYGGGKVTIYRENRIEEVVSGKMATLN